MVGKPADGSADGSYLKALHGLPCRSSGNDATFTRRMNGPASDEAIARARARVRRSKTVLDVETILADRDADRRDEQIELQLAEASGLTVGSPPPQSPSGDDTAQPGDDSRCQGDGTPGRSGRTRPASREELHSLDDQP
jgi:hypothetical protein